MSQHVSAFCEAPRIVPGRFNDVWDGWLYMLKSPSESVIMPTRRRASPAVVTQLIVSAIWAVSH